MSTQFNCQKHFYFKLFSLFKQLYITIQFSVSTVSMSKTVQFQTIQFKCKYSLIVKNISISIHTLIIQIRKEMNLLVRSRPWLTTIPWSQSDS